MKKPGYAFTLIELLIVVAIIAILAAIAVPNFLEAQTRSKLSRLYADMSSLATALETYYVDHNSYPDTPNSGDTYIQYIPMLTTPVAYMTTIIVQDPFFPRHSQYTTGPDWKATCHYVNYAGKWGRSCTTPYNPKGYVISSYGPIRKQAGLEWFPYYYCYLNEKDTALAMVYDPTNGTKSWGGVGRVGGSIDGPRTLGH